MSQQAEQGDESALLRGVIPRPFEVIQELPVRYQWEFTRRHPYYFTWWQTARRHRQSPSSNAADRFAGEAAVFMLLSIGVTGAPPDPALGPDALEIPSLAGVWQNGAVAPLTFRGLVGALVTQLPAETRTRIARFIERSTQPESDGAPEGYRAFSEFLQLEDPALDAMVMGPIVSVNPNAPQRTIVRTMEELVRQWKRERGIPERRRRDDKLSEYLAVWDRREGWTGDHYDGRQERRFPDIARELSVSLRTAANRYRSAFRYIVGQDYAWEIWWRLFGLTKTHPAFTANPPTRLATRRPYVPRQARLVPESVLHPDAPDGEHGFGFLDSLTSEEARDPLVLEGRIRQLISQGLDNAEIADQLGFSLNEEDANRLIDYFRSRHEDGLF